MMDTTTTNKGGSMKTAEGKRIALEQWLLEGDGTGENPGLNQEQQAAVTCHHNTVAAAGAGAGKTFVLARRYAYLVCVRKMKVTEILTLTFTRKATAEMYSRIYQTLVTIAQLFATEEAIQAVADFHSARIQTLDSYCSSIIRHSVGHYGIKPDFTIDDQQAKVIATQMALPFVLRHRHNPAIQLMATTTMSRLDNLAQELFAQTMVSHASLAKPLNFVQMIEDQLNHASTSCTRLAQDIHQLMGELQHLIDEEGSSKSTFVPKLQAALGRYHQEEWNPALLAANPDRAITFCLLVEGVARLPLNGQHTKPWNAPLKHLKDTSYPNLASLVSFLYRQGELRELARLLEEFQLQYNRTKRQAGILTFSDAAQLALDTVKTRREVRQEEKEAYKAIMIDEFQDDNILQKELLYALAEEPDTFNQGTVPPECLSPGKLFFVGDEKQSIYRFRGADVSVFRGLSRELSGHEEPGLSRELSGHEEPGLSRELSGHEEPGLSREIADGGGRGAALSLSYNYRSHPTLIAAFNTIFGGLPYRQGGRSHDYPEAVFMADTDATPDYEATYQEVLAGKDSKAESHHDQHRRRIHLCLFQSQEEKDELHKDHCEAYFVARKIKELKESGRKLSDIAILFRTTTKQHLYEAYLRKEGLAYTSEATVNFFQDAPTNDILSFLTLFLYPANQTAYSTLLRSPFVGISPQGLEILLAAQAAPSKASQGEGAGAIFNREDSRLLPNGEEAAAFATACEIYHQLAPLARTMPIPQLVSCLWYQLGYRYKVMERAEALQYAPLYDKLFHLAVQADNQGTSLAGFVQALQQEVDNEGKMEDMDIPLEQEEGVQLMTIHKSKGLEFPVVFLVNSNGRPKANKNDAAVYYHQHWGVTLNLPRLQLLNPKQYAPNYFYLCGQQEEIQRELAELRRILYVALTRAEDEIFVTACPEKLDKDNPGKFKASDNPNTMFKLLVPLVNSTITLGEYGTPITLEPDAPFDAAWIPSVTRQQIQQERGTAPVSTPLQLAQSLESLYHGEPVLPTVVESSYRSPSQLAPASLEYQQEILQAGEASQGGASGKIAQLVRSSLQPDGKPSFTYADFGTCTHLYLEAALKNQQPMIPTKYLQHLSPENRQLLHELCSAMAQTFLSSSLSQAVRTSPWKKAEYRFVHRLGTAIVKGSMDLIYQTEQSQGGLPCYQIVDYKTDQEERPEQYTIQQAAYRKAAAAICGVPEENISCTLYYLRTGNLVDITSACSQVNLERLVELAEESEG